MRRESISPGWRRVRGASTLGACTGLLAAIVALTSTSCGAFCSQQGCADGGAWFQLSGPDGSLLAEREFEIQIETGVGSASVVCEGGPYGPVGECTNEVIFFSGANGMVAVGELSFDEETEAPVLAMQVFERVPIPDSDDKNIRGPESLTVRVLVPSGTLLEHSFEPTYARSGNERCGFCDRVDEPERIEVDLTADE